MSRSIPDPVESIATAAGVFVFLTEPPKVFYSTLGAGPALTLIGTLYVWGLFMTVGIYLELR